MVRHHGVLLSTTARYPQTLDAARHAQSPAGGDQPAMARRHSAGVLCTDSGLPALRLVLASMSQCRLRRGRGAQLGAALSVGPIWGHSRMARHRALVDAIGSSSTLTLRRTARRVAGRRLSASRKPAPAFSASSAMDRMAARDDDRQHAGLCADCAHARRIETSRGSTFYLCLRAELEPAFRKYPQLPVRICAGYVPATSSSTD